MKFCSFSLIEEGLERLFTSSSRSSVPSGEFMDAAAEADREFLLVFSARLVPGRNKVSRKQANARGNSLCFIGLVYRVFNVLCSINIIQGINVI